MGGDANSYENTLMENIQLQNGSEATDVNAPSKQCTLKSVASLPFCSWMFGTTTTNSIQFWVALLHQSRRMFRRELNCTISRSNTLLDVHFYGLYTAI